MPEVRFHSRVFAVVRELRRLLADAQWPTHPDTTDAPLVQLGQPGEPHESEHNEVVGVVNRVTDEATIEWDRQSPGGRRERFTVDVVVRTFVPGVVDQGHVIDRLEVLADVVQGVIYDPATLQFTPIDNTRPWSVQLGGIASVTFDVVPVGTDGWGGIAVVSFDCVVRI
jgi:hypothetical protein